MRNVKKYTRSLLIILLIGVFSLSPFFVAHQARAQQSYGAIGQMGALATICIATWLGILEAQGPTWEAEAIGRLDLVPTISGGTNEILALSSLHGLTTSNTMKECTWDGLAWVIVNMIMEMVLHEIAIWIANGFEGGPAFITDPEQFFLDVGDILAGELLFGGDLRVLCSPFQLQLQLNILLRYFGVSMEEKNYCKLSDVVNNVSNFFEGAFEEGGWPAWFNVSVQPRQNLWDAMIGVEGDMALSIRSRTKSLSWSIANGDGFFGIFNKAKNFVAPGKYVQAQITKQMGWSYDRLTVADEINEIIGAIIALLIQKTLGPGGLLGLGAKEYDSNGSKVSYLDLLQQESRVAGGKDELLTTVDTLIIEVQTKPEYADKLTRLTEIRTELVALQETDVNYATTLAGLRAEVMAIEQQLGLKRTMEELKNNLGETPAPEGPTPPPGDGLPGAPGTDPSGGNVNAGDTTNPGGGGVPPVTNLPSMPGTSPSGGTIDTNPVTPGLPPAPPALP